MHGGQVGCTDADLQFLRGKIDFSGESGYAKNIRIQQGRNDDVSTGECAFLRSDQ